MEEEIQEQKKIEVKSPHLSDINSMSAPPGLQRITPSGDRTIPEVLSTPSPVPPQSVRVSWMRAMLLGLSALVFPSLTGATSVPVPQPPEPPVVSAETSLRATRAADQRPPPRDDQGLSITADMAKTAVLQMLHVVSPELPQAEAQRIAQLVSPRLSKRCVRCRKSPPPKRPGMDEHLC